MNDGIIVKPHEVFYLGSFDYLSDGVTRHEFAIYSVNEGHEHEFNYIDGKAGYIKTWKTKEGAIRYYKKKLSDFVLIDKSKLQ